MKETRFFNKNFNILMFGSFISMLGGVAAGTAIGFQVYDETQSVLLFALTQVFYYVPKFFVPIMVGPYVDTHSRKRIIVTLDFIYTFLFIGITYALFTIGFNLIILLVLNVLLSILDSVYGPAFDSLFPDTCKKDKLDKAYSISVLIGPLSNIIVMPIVVIAYNKFGLEYIMLFNALTFLFAAVIEIFINVEESIKESSESTFKEDFKEGVDYLKVEKGVKAIFIFSFFQTLVWGCHQTLLLPYFETTTKVGFGKESYAMLTLIMTVTRLGTGLFQSAFITHKPEKKFNRARKLHIILGVATLFIYIGPLEYIFFVWGLIGMLGIVTLTVRESALAQYIPGNMRGRLLGIRSTAIFAGLTIGTLVSGVLGEYYNLIVVGTAFTVIELISALFIFNYFKKDLTVVYNKDTTKDTVEESLS